MREDTKEDAEELVHGVVIVHWNPLRNLPTTGAPGLVNNFGDLLGPLIVHKLVETLTPTVAAHATRRLLTVGSIAHLAHDDDVVWGSGVNGKVPIDEIRAQRLDIRAVRGPRTRTILRRLGHSVPPTYGDPALLLPRLFPEVSEWSRHKTRPVTIIPNLNDEQVWPPDNRTVSARGNVWEVIRAIAESEFVIGSSLHAIIVAEALGVPARPCLSETENRLKYDDYFEGTARKNVVLADGAAEAFALGPVEKGDIDLESLRASFPVDLWAG